MFFRDRLKHLLPILSDLNELIDFYFPLKSLENLRFSDDFRRVVVNSLKFDVSSETWRRSLTILWQFLKNTKNRNGYEIGQYESRTT